MVVLKGLTNKFGLDWIGCITQYLSAGSNATTGPAPLQSHNPTHLGRGEHGVAPPAVPGEHPGVEPEAHRPGIRGDAVLHLILQLVHAGKVVSGSRSERHEGE